jgi:membrane protein
MVRTMQELGADDASHMAAGIAYYGIFSLFPLLLGLIALLGMFLPSETVQEELFEFFRQNLPGSVDVLERNIDAVIQLRGALGVLSLIGLFWGGSAVFGAVSRAVNRAWDVHQDRPFLKRKLRDLTMAMGVGILFLLSLGGTSLFAILSSLDVPVLGGAVNFGSRFLAFLFSLAIFLVIYKFIPNTKTYWRYVWSGAVLAAILFEVAKGLFVFYLSHFADYQSVYGSVGSVIVLLLWIYVSAFILILGAEFSSEYGRLREGVSRGVPLAAQRASDGEPKRKAPG